MQDSLTIQLKDECIRIGKLLWEKDLVTGFNGNISARVAGSQIVLTGHKTSLGFLECKDLILMDTDGTLLEAGQVSSEKLMHTAIYQKFPDIQAVVHSHTVFANAYFLDHSIFESQIFEAKFYLGQVLGIPQSTPSVTDVQPILDALKSNNIVALKNHGVVAMGKNLFDCFVLIQALEEALKIEAFRRLYGAAVKEFRPAPAISEAAPSPEGKTYQLFSEEQIKEIIRVVNADAQLKAMGEQTQMTMDLAVKLNETGAVYSFSFVKGRIDRVGHDENAEFLISAPEAIWRSVFNREIDPFVATTQKKMALRGDFAKISKWYAPCSRIFELWQKVPVA